MGYTLAAATEDPCDDLLNYLIQSAASQWQENKGARYDESQ
jgi:hypothetical protein